MSLLHWKGDEITSASRRTASGRLCPISDHKNLEIAAWLYQFVSEGKGGLYYESKTGLGIMNIMLIYNDRKYIIETKVKRYRGTVDETLEQLAEKYLLPERVSHGYQGKRIWIY